MLCAHGTACCFLDSTCKISCHSACPSCCCWHCCLLVCYDDRPTRAHAHINACPTQPSHDSGLGADDTYADAGNITQGYHLLPPAPLARDAAAPTRRGWDWSLVHQHVSHIANMLLSARMCCCSSWPVASTHNASPRTNRHSTRLLMQCHRAHCVHNAALWILLTSSSLPACLHTACAGRIVTEPISLTNWEGARACEHTLTPTIPERLPSLPIGVAPHARGPRDLGRSC